MAALASLNGKRQVVESGYSMEIVKYDPAQRGSKSTVDAALKVTCFQSTVHSPQL